MQEQSPAAREAELVLYRCPHCNRLLFKGCVRYVEIKCPRCGYVYNVSGRACPPAMQKTPMAGHRGRQG